MFEQVQIGRFPPLPVKMQSSYNETLINLIQDSLFSRYLPTNPENSEWLTITSSGRIGHGFTTMIMSFIKTLQNRSKETGINLSPVIGLDVRKRSDLGMLGVSFMILGPTSFA